MKRIYLDYAAATPVSRGVVHAMIDTIKNFSGNPSAIHQEGTKARVVLETARENIAKILVAYPNEIIFTSGATEANNLALHGVVKQWIGGNRKPTTYKSQPTTCPRIIISAIEHSSVVETARALEQEGIIMVDEIEVNSCGLIDPLMLRKLIKPETIVVSIMYANNEIGTIQPIHDIAKEVRHARKINKSIYPYFHTDAAQAANFLNLNVAQLGVDLMTLSSGKSYGPRGIGVLFVKRGINISPLIYGGGQENGIRSGTESPALATGFSVALKEAQTIKKKELVRIKKLRDLLATGILKKIIGVTINGDTEFNLQPITYNVQANYRSLPNILNISIDGVETDALVLYLDATGVAVSGQSACKSLDKSFEKNVSHGIIKISEKLKVKSEKLKDMGIIRFSLGRETTRDHIKKVIIELTRIVELLRKIF